MVHCDRYDARRAAGIFREAIQATGGPQSDAIAAVKNYIDARYPAFPWHAKWHAQVRGAKAAERTHLQLPACHAAADANGPDDVPPADAVEAAETIGAAQIEAARLFIEKAGHGSVEQAREVYAYITELPPGAVPQIGPAMDVWDELMDAVGSDPETAERVLSVFTRRVAPLRVPPEVAPPPSSGAPLQAAG